MRTDVLIIGGGLAGLTAARRLSAAGVDFRLAEARSRLGGRILSAGLDGYDLGPAWFWPGQARVARLARDLGLGVFRQYAAGRTVFEDAAGAVRRDLAIALNPEALRIEGGMARPVGALAREIGAELRDDRVWLGHRLTAVETNGARRRALLDGPRGVLTVEARAVVIAIPPRIASRDIAFSPAVSPEAAAALGGVPTWMAGHAKMVALYDQPFWRAAGLSGDAVSQRGPLAQIHDASPAHAGSGALFGFVGVDAAARAQRGEAALRADAAAQLARLFGDAAGAPTEILLADWAAEPLTAVGADRAAPAGHPAYGPRPALDALAAQGVIFGSTEVAPEAGGFVEGAIASGERAAAQAMRVLGKQGMGKQGMGKRASGRAAAAE